MALGRRRADQARRRRGEGQDAALVAREDRSHARGPDQEGVRACRRAQAPEARRLGGALRQGGHASVVHANALRLRCPRRHRVLRHVGLRRHGHARKGPCALRRPSRVPPGGRRRRCARLRRARARRVPQDLRQEARQGARRGVRGVPRRLPEAVRRQDGGRRPRRGEEGADAR